MRRFSRGWRIATRLALSIVGTTVLAQEPQWIPPLASGGAPDCPERLGSRTYRSEIAQNASTRVFISGTSERKANGCRAMSEIRTTRSGETRAYPLPVPNMHGFHIIDFSPDGSELLLASDLGLFDDRYQRRDVSVSLMPLASGKMEWFNAWDLFGWKDCDAMVEPQGFLPDGKIVIRARKSVIAAQPHPNCVNDVGLYVIDPANRQATRLPDSTKIERYGKEERPAFQACKEDPDIVAACFSVHGRLSAYNGTPTLRMWRIGTDRMLGVRDEFPLPESLEPRVNWDVNVYGDYVVCPLTHQRGGEMQVVCVESANHVVVNKR